MPRDFASLNLVSIHDAYPMSWERVDNILFPYPEEYKKRPSVRNDCWENPHHYVLYERFPNSDLVLVQWEKILEISCFLVWTLELPQHPAMFSPFPLLEYLKDVPDLNPFDQQTNDLVRFSNSCPFVDKTYIADVKENYNVFIQSEDFNIPESRVARFQFYLGSTYNYVRMALKFYQGQFSTKKLNSVYKSDPNQHIQHSIAQFANSGFFGVPFHEPKSLATSVLTNTSNAFKALFVDHPALALVFRDDAFNGFYTFISHYSPVEQSVWVDRGARFCQNLDKPLSAFRLNINRIRGTNERKHVKIMNCVKQLHSWISNHREVYQTPSIKLKIEVVPIIIDAILDFPLSVSFVHTYLKTIPCGSLFMQELLYTMTSFILARNPVRWIT